MPKLTELVDAILCETRFDAGSHGTFSADQVRSLHSGGDPYGQFMVRGAKAVVPEPLHAVLVERLGAELQAYIEPDTQRIGTGLVGLTGGALNDAEPTVAEFARTLIRAASTLGSARAVEILRGWIEGEPYRFRMKVLLTGARCEEPLSMEEGVQVTPLPAGGYAADLVPYLPYSLASSGANLLDFMGRAVLSIDGAAEPALYRPTLAHDDRPDWNLRQIWAGGRIPSLMTVAWRERLSEALSLACDHCVRWTHIWRDVGDVQAFNRSDAGYEFRDVSGRGEAVCVRQEHLEAARELDVQRHARAQGRKALDMAIGRWINSKRPNVALPDRFIDLRIALEAMFVGDSRTEMRFRLAFFAAWYLGADFEERRRYYDLLRRAYDCGSRAVHTGDVEDTPDNRETLSAAQRACRTAILKRLEETDRPKWDEVDVALGAAQAIPPEAK